MRGCLRGFWSNCTRSLLGLAIAGLVGVHANEVELVSTNQVRTLTLHETLRMALLQNRELQIERLNPAIARFTLDSSYGYYDPFLFTDWRYENASDSGGFDPSDFSRDAVYSAESKVARTGITGFLPSGMSYSLSGTYANSYGERNGLNFDSYSVGASVFLQQPLLKNAWIDQGRYLIKVNRKYLKITELGVSYMAMDVLNRTQQAYYELVFTREYLRVQAELLRARQRTLAGQNRMVEEGLLIESDTLPTRSQIAVLETQLIGSSNAVMVAENELRTLIGDDFVSQPDARLEPAETLLVFPEVVDLQTSWARGLAQRPDLAQLRTDVERRQIDVKYRRNQLFPSLDLIGGYGRRGASVSQLPPPLSAQASASDAFDQLSAGNAPTEMIGIIFSVPLGRQMERSNFRMSNELRKQAELLVKQLEELVLRQISDAYHGLRLSLERIRSAERASAYANDALSAEVKKLAGGRSDVFFVLQLQNDLLDARATELRAKADYLKMISQYYFSEGSLLERLDFAVEFE